MESKFISGSRLKTKQSVKKKYVEKSFVCERLSETQFDQTVNLLATKDHIQGILDVKKYSKKFVCETCNWSFSTLCLLQSHKCQNKPRYITEQRVIFPEPLERVCSKMMQEPFVMDSSFGFVELQQINSSIELKVAVKLGGNSLKSVQTSFQSITQCAKFLISYFDEVIPHLLGPRLAKNVHFLAQLEKALNQDMLNASQAKFEFDECKIRYGQFLKIKEAVMKHLQCVPVFVMTKSTQLVLGEKLIFEILNLLSLNGSSADLTLCHMKSKIACVGRSGHLAEWKLINLLSSCFMKDQLDNEAYKFDQIVYLFKKDFGINILQADSLSMLGKMMIAASLDEKCLLSMQSPSKILYEGLQDCIKFGLIGTRPLVIHPKGPYKSAISIDITKHYLNCLGETSGLLGHGLMYEKNPTKNYFSCQPSRNRATFANILLLTINGLVEQGNIFHSLFGSEIRAGHGFPVDGVLHLHSGEKWILSINGCLWHGHEKNDPNFICHMNYEAIPTSHLETCPTCMAHCKKSEFDVMKPTLFRLKKGETEDSKHPVIKSMTFKEVNERSKTNLEKVSQNSTYNAHVIISECMVLRYYYKTVGEFMLSLGIPFKHELGSNTLGKAMTQVAELHFPLLKKRKKLGTKEVIQAVKANEIHGFINLSCKIDDIGKKKMDLLAPFSYRNDKGVTEHLHYTVNKTVSTSMIRFLLNSEDIPDFEITAINHIIEYKRSLEQPFAPIKDKVMRSIKNHKQNNGYTKMLKECMNGAIGSLAYNRNNYKTTIPFTKEDSLSVAQLKNFVRASPVNDVITLYHFKKNLPILNLSHLHNEIITHGKVVLLEIALTLQECCLLSQSMINTDGIQLASPLKPTEELLHNRNDPFLLDYFLKSHLLPRNIKRYVSFKFRHFEHTGVCENHRLRYESCLQQRKQFVQEQCCKEHRNENVSNFIIKMEIVANFGIVHSYNRLALFNSLSKQYMKKSGGSSALSNINFETLSYNELSNLLVH